MFAWFTDTKETIPDGLGITGFGPEHLCWLAALLVAGALVLWAIRREPARCGKIGRVLAVLLVLDELFKQGMLLAFGNWEAQYLPLHMCSINIFVAVANEVRSTRLTRALLYATCIPAAVMALLFPTWVRLPVLNFMSIHSFTVHGLLLLYPLALWVGGQLKPQPRDLWRVAAFYVVILPFIYVFNKRFDTNFMFLNFAAPGTPLVLFENWLGNPGYLLGIPVLLGLIWAVMYVPLVLYRRRVSPKAPSQG